MLLHMVVFGIMLWTCLSAGFSILSARFSILCSLYKRITDRSGESIRTIMQGHNNWQQRKGLDILVHSHGYYWSDKNPLTQMIQWLIAVHKATRTILSGEWHARWCKKGGLFSYADWAKSLYVIEKSHGPF